MNIHEYQAKELFGKYGVPVPVGKTGTTPEEAVEAAKFIGKFPVVVKAQVHKGGRGKAGGVKLAKSLDDVRTHATNILGMNIGGNVVRRVLVDPGADIKTEIYLSIVLDRAGKGHMIMASAEGGMDIEEVAAKHPEKLLRLHLEPTIGLKGYHIQQVADFCRIPDSALPTFFATVKGLYKLVTEKDASMAEVNPLVVLGDGTVMALDGKVSFDDNALFLHPDVEALRDDGEEEPLEVEARNKKLNYVKLDGRIGCIVNGAGLAMYTMDIVKHFGGEPANFLDIGGGAKSEQVADALRLITSDPHVDTIFFNIFGGIVRCDLVAKGILDALASMPDFKYPIVIRLSGTNETEAKMMLASSPLKIAPTMAEGAKLAVETSKAIRG